MAISGHLAEVALLVRLPRAYHFFDYAIPDDLVDKITEGDLVEIPFRTKVINGIVVKVKKESLVKVKLKSIHKITAKNYLTHTQLQLSKHLAKHYGLAWGSVLRLCVPFLPNQRFKPSSDISPQTHRNIKNNYQIIIAINNRRQRVELVNSLAQKIIKRQQQFLLLVPELNYLEFWKKILSPHFTLVAYSAEMATTQKRQTWELIRQKKNQIIIGTRAALFLPFSNLGGIVIDYAENENYKQYDQNPRYQTLEVAEWLADLNNASLAKLSPAPPIEEWYKATQKKEFWNQLNTKRTTKFIVVNSAIERQSGNKDIMSATLKIHLENTLAKKQKTFLYFNRRGTATNVMCQDCGLAASCKICQRHLVWDDKTNILSCYHCNIKQKIIIPCPRCGGINLKYTGSGLGRLANEIVKYYPQLKLLTLEGLDHPTIKEINQADIIIGSKTAWKFIDFTKINLIGLVAPDIELSLPELRAVEEVWATARFFITSGTQTVIAQTYRPDHYLWQSLLKNDMELFYKEELKERKKFNYPPACSLIKFISQNATESAAIKHAKQVAAIIKPKLNSYCELTGPYPDYYHQMRGKYRFHILLRYQAKYFNTESLWPLLPDDLIIDKHPWSILS